MLWKNKDLGVSNHKHEEFFFIGERPSNRAFEMDVTWRDGALVAATLFDALRNINLDPCRQHYKNLYTSPVRGAATDAADERRAVKAARRAVRRGLMIVGMGRIVHRVLTREGILHLQLRHPAARGLGRRRDLFRTHTREVLTQRGNDDGAQRGRSTSCSRLHS